MTDKWYPDNNPNWKEHTPGDPMPCRGHEFVHVLSNFEREDKDYLEYPDVAENFAWGETDCAHGYVVAWCPVDDDELKPSNIVQLKEALRSALKWIDAVPSDTVLPAMPGFDRDHANELLSR